MTRIAQSSEYADDVEFSDATTALLPTPMESGVGLANRDDSDSDPSLTVAIQEQLEPLVDDARETRPVSDGNRPSSLPTLHPSELPTAPPADELPED